VIAALVRLYRSRRQPAVITLVGDAHASVSGKTKGEYMLVSSADTELPGYPA